MEGGRKGGPITDTDGRREMKPLLTALSFYGPELFVEGPLMPTILRLILGLTTDQEGDYLIPVIIFLH